MITKQREDGECGRHNFKGLDKSVAHYDAGDIQIIGYFLVFLTSF